MGDEMKDPWLWISEFIGAVTIFAFFYFLIWILAILFPGAM